MAFTVGDFQDLLRLLEQHPEWRAQLRQHILPDELLQLPELVRSLAEAQRRTDEQLARLTERVDELTGQMTELTRRVDALTARVDALVAQVQAVVTRVGDMDGELLELTFARRAPAYLGRLGRRFRVIDPSQLAHMLDDAVEEGRLTEEERDSAMLADIVVRGRRKPDDAEVYFVVELSAGVGVGDVSRAVHRSSVLAKLGQPVVPVVAGRWINFDAQQYASSNGVEQLVLPRRHRESEPGLAS